MDFLADLAAWSVLLFALLLFACQMISHSLGYVLGSRLRTSGRAQSVDGIGLVVSSLLGLLAFILALTLSYGSARYSERRAGMLTEAKAIGTAWLQAQAIGHPLGYEIADLLKQYGTLRRDFVLETRNSPAIDEIRARCEQVKAQIWERVSAVVRERPDDVTSSLMASVNDTFDAGTAERFALETKFPPQLLWLLIGIALVSMAAFGYQLGMSGHKLHALLSLLIAVWTAVVVVILDLSAPRLGNARTSTAVYDWTLQGMVERRPDQHSSRDGKKN